MEKEKQLKKMIMDAEDKIRMYRREIQEQLIVQELAERALEELNK